MWTCVDMEVLDGDNNRLSSRGRYAARDIVQVVDTLIVIAVAVMSQ